MSSSITTSLPTGAIPQWCILPETPRKSLFNPGCPATYDQNGTVARSTDFQSICCDGVIVDTSLDLYSSDAAYPFSNPDTENSTRPVDLADLICCGVSGVQSEALSFSPPKNLHTACAAGTQSTPLASLAATNASQASTFPVTYASNTPTSTPTPTSGGDPSATVTNDLWGWNTGPTYGASGTPVCLWVYTQSGVSMAEVTVPATYVASEDTGSAVTSTSTPSAAFSFARAPSGGRLCVTLGLMALALLV
ncbi:hypothetical protein M426DRAFT_123868 [Hypoxylon sp. CI-4A]|nr:hypothetical protein M426DRAFT_123868 [Hypoxylon sp. CI-4A]